MILTEIRNFIESTYRSKSQSQMSNYKYIRGYLDGLKTYGVINLREWHELNNYNHEIFHHGLDVEIDKIKISVN